jgi:hypothetical protein
MRLKKLESYNSRSSANVFCYLVVFDPGPGCKNKYTVMITSVDDPVIIGRELDMKTARWLISSYESFARNLIPFSINR